MTHSSQPKNASTAELYTGHDLCPELCQGQMCFRAKIYKDGLFETVFHEHVPSHRLSQDSANEALRSLVAKYSEWPGVFILHSLLNKRGRSPQRYPGFIHHVDYPESGVIRHTVISSNAHAWHDEVISAATFRQSLDSITKGKQ